MADEIIKTTSEVKITFDIKLALLLFFERLKLCNVPKFFS